jgi:hypothetical protein
VASPIAADDDDAAARFVETLIDGMRFAPGRVGTLAEASMSGAWCSVRCSVR